jgi:hypothetical protein
MAVLTDARGNEYSGQLDQIGGGTVTDPRAPSQNLSALNAEVVMDLNGHATVFVDVRGTFSATLVFEGTVNGTDYFAIPTLNFSTQAYVASITAVAQLLLNVAGFRRVRARVSAYTSGSAVVAMRATTSDAIIQVERLPMTLGITATGAAGAAVTLTIPSATGLFHYIDHIRIEHFATALLTAAAAPVIVTTTNLPGTPSYNFRADAAAQGTLTEKVIQFGAPVRSSAAGTNTTVVCPATTGVLWRATAAYRLGV